MYRRGHVGIAMLAYAPVGFVLLRERRLSLALLGLMSVLAVEPLPDNDMWIPGLDHRGTSHSLFAALVVGGILGALGWVVGDQLGAFLIGLDSSTVGVFADVFEVVGKQLRGLDERALATFGFVVGAGGILVHLLGDVITVYGIKPFLPLSGWRLSLSSLRAKNRFANNALFGLGAVALVLVVLTTVPAGIALPTGLSPIGAADAAGQNATSNASVAFANQTSNGSNVTIASATLPKGGFVAIHDSGYTTGAESAESSIIATSKYLKPGNYTNFTIEVSNAPPGNYLGLNRSRLNSSSALTAMVHRDTDGNKRMDYVRSGGANDTAYTIAKKAVADSASVTVPAETRRQASVTVRNQTLRGDTLSVEKARLPDGGFLVVHNESYLGSNGDPLESAVGVTDHLEPGKHQGVGVPLLDGAVEEDQTLIVVPYRDTNHNERYDYIASDGLQDTAYENRSRTRLVIVNDTAQVVVSDSAREEETTTSTSMMTTTSTPANTSTPFRLTNLSVSNRTAHVGDELTVTAWIENPTDHRLESELKLATVGDIADTQDVALFPNESQAVTFDLSYDAAGKYVIKVGEQTREVQIVEEGAPLPTVTTTAAGPTTDGNETTNGSVQGAQSDDAIGLTSPPVLIAGVVLVLVAGGWYARRRRNQNDF